MVSNPRSLVIAVLVVVLAAAGGWYLWNSRDTGPRVTWKNADEDMVKLDVIKPGVTVSPTFTVRGEARGTWFFEASFPVEVLDKDGNRLTVAVAQAEGEWMTEEFVSFSAPVTIENYSGPATLVLHRDNASGLPEHDASMSVPIEVLDTQ
jgi:hypothetical protein